MAEKVSLILTVKNSPSDSAKQRTVTNVSASATDQELYDFLSAYAALSTDTAVGYAKVVRKDLEANNNG